jgi:4-oxalocrotonate tautomerase
MMPYINLQITRGATRSQKEVVVREFTDTLVRVLGKKPEHIHIVIQEIADEDWGFAGMLTDDFGNSKADQAPNGQMQTEDTVRAATAVPQCLRTMQP